MSGSRNFCQLYLVLSLFYSLMGVPMVLLLRKLYVYFSKDPERVHYFREGAGRGCPTFSRGGGEVKMLISIETHIRI